jgi:hypothetical protein
MNHPRTIRDPVLRAVTTEFYPRFTPGGKVLWVREGTHKLVYRSRANVARRALGAMSPAELPNIGIHYSKRGWLVVVDIAGIRGAISSIRCQVLGERLSSCRLGLVFVTAFRSREAFQVQGLEPAWQTVAWFSNEPDHLVHFDGMRLFGPKRGKHLRKPRGNN